MFENNTSLPNLFEVAQQLKKLGGGSTGMHSPITHNSSLVGN